MPLTYTCPTCGEPHGAYDEYLAHEKGHPRMARVGIPKPLIRFVDQAQAQRDKA